MLSAALAVALVATSCGSTAVEDTDDSSSPSDSSASSSPPPDDTVPPDPQGTTPPAAVIDDVAADLLPLDPGWTGEVWPVPAQPAPGEHVNDVAVTRSDGTTIWLSAGTPLMAEVADDDPSRIVVRLDSGEEAIGHTSDFWFIPSFVDLRLATVERDGVDVSLTEADVIHHRVNWRNFDDPDTPEFDAIASVIRRFLDCTADTWKIANQYFAADVIADGLHTGDRQMVQRGVDGLDWGIALPFDEWGVFTLTRECDGTAMRDPSEQHHSTQWLVGLARGVHLLAATPWAGEYRAALDRYIEHLETLTKRLADPAVRAHWYDNWVLDPRPDNGVFNHKFYMRAAGLSLVANLTDDESFADRLRADARAIAEDGMAAQWDNGVNPERNGHEVRYQMYGSWLAAVYWSSIPESPHRDAVAATLDKAIAWMNTRIDEHGVVDITGSTRTCRNDPTVSEYHPGHLVSTYLLWDVLQGRQELTEIARIHSDTHRVFGSPCPEADDAGN